MPDVKTPDPVLEVTRHLRELEQRGSRRLAAQLVESVTTDTARQAEALRHAADRRDATALFRAAHTLQGTAAIVGADSVADMCAQIVRSSRKGSFAQLDVIVAQVVPAVDAICQAVDGAGPRAIQRQASADVDAPPFRRPASACWSSTTMRDPQDYADTRRRTWPRSGVGARRRRRAGQAARHRPRASRRGDAGPRRLRRVPPHPPASRRSDIPVIIVTTFETMEHRLLAVEAGANDFIAKPIEQTELRVRTTSLLKMKEAQDR